MDNYVFLETKGDTLDKDYINRELIKLDIADYEKKLADMSYRLFANPERIFEDEFNLYNLMAHSFLSFNLCYWFLYIR